MKVMKNKKYKDWIFRYDKNNNLIQYVELNNNHIQHYYEFNNNILQKIYEYINETGGTETLRSYNVFSGDCALHHLIIDGESWVTVTSHNECLLGGRRIMAIEKFEVENGCPTIYPIKYDLINEWAKKAHLN